MKQKPRTSEDTDDRPVKGIRRETRKYYSSEEKIRLAGLRGQESIFAQS